MSERCAVIGIGQTVAKSKREDVSIAGWCARPLSWPSKMRA